MGRFWVGLLAHGHLTYKLAPGFEPFAHAGGIRPQGCIKTPDRACGIGPVGGCRDLFTPQGQETGGKMFEFFVIR